MRSGTKLFLLLGCACVLALEIPGTLADLSAGWRGPYVRALLPTLLPAHEPGLESGIGDARLGSAPGVERSSEVLMPRPRGRLELARR